MKNMDKWIKEYISNIDIGSIEWIKLNGNELDKFLENNYLDREEWEYVLDEDANSLYPTILGMNYLNLNDPRSEITYNFLLGIADNNASKKTIVGDIIYLDKYFMFKNQLEPLTYIATVEVNSYFRNMGICKKMYSASFDFINPNQHILTSMLSQDGKTYNILEIHRQIAKEKGFKKQIIEKNNSLKISYLYDLICPKQKVLKK